MRGQQYIHCVLFDRTIESLPHRVVLLDRVVPRLRDVRPADYDFVTLPVGAIRHQPAATVESGDYHIPAVENITVSHFTHLCTVSRLCLAHTTGTGDKLRTGLAAEFRCRIRPVVRMISRQQDEPNRPVFMA